MHVELLESTICGLHDHALMACTNLQLLTTDTSEVVTADNSWQLQQHGLGV